MVYHFKDRIQLTETIFVEGGFRDPIIEKEVVVKELWADIRTMRGKEIASNFDYPLNTEISNFIVRYTPGIEYKYKLKYNGKEYTIKSITNDDERNRTITIVAETKVTS